MLGLEWMVDTTKDVVTIRVGRRVTKSYFQKLTLSDATARVNGPLVRWPLGLPGAALTDRAGQWDSLIRRVGPCRENCCFSSKFFFGCLLVTRP